MASRHIVAESIGPIAHADVRFGNLTVFVGPQATGKSILLQLFKLLVDKRSIHRELKRFNLQWDRDLASFLELYFGEGMSSLWVPPSSVLRVDGKAADLAEYARSRRGEGNERMFYIPAQRVMSRYHIIMCLQLQSR